MIFVDTGYLVALLDRRDELHDRAVAWHRVLGDSMLTTEYVIWEMLNSFSAREDRPKGHDALAKIRTLSSWVLVAASPQLFEAGVLMHHQRADKEWSLTDCSSFVVMGQRGIQRALTYDHHFEQAGFEALLRRDPP